LGCYNCPSRRSYAGRRSLVDLLKLFGIRAAYDEIVATAVKRQQEPQRIIGDLLTAELSEKRARSMR
jgi:hypothetical protein